MADANTESDALEQVRLNPEYLTTSGALIDELFNSPIPRSELSRNLFLYLDRRALARFLFMNELYQMSIPLHGSIFEFGVRYGVNTALLTSLRGIHEPYNHNRKIVSFDTFSGFPAVDDQRDGAQHSSGDFGVPAGYEAHLERIIGIHEKLAPLEQIKKFEIVKDDVNEALPRYLEDHQETILSFAYFDFDLYAPTYNSLCTIEKFLSPGAVIGFDEINVREWPGETRALREWMGERNMAIRHSNLKPSAGYVIYQRKTQTSPIYSPDVRSSVG